MSGFKEYIENESQVNSEDLIELADYYAKIINSMTKMNMEPSKEIEYNAECIRRELTRREKQ